MTDGSFEISSSYPGDVKEIVDDCIKGEEPNKLIKDKKYAVQDIDQVYIKNIVTSKKTPHPCLYNIFRCVYTIAISQAPEFNMRTVRPPTIKCINLPNFTGLDGPTRFVYIKISSIFFPSL